MSGIEKEDLRGKEGASASSELLFVLVIEIVVFDGRAGTRSSLDSSTSKYGLI